MPKCISKHFLENSFFDTTAASNINTFFTKNLITLLEKNLKSIIFKIIMM